MEVLEKRTIDDQAAVEDTMTSQLISKLKEVLGIAEDDHYEFKFVMSEMEATMDEDMDEEGAIEESQEATEKKTDTEEEQDND